MIDWADYTPQILIRDSICLIAYAVFPAKITAAALD